MPPEQARGETDRIDERADVFALGSILCEVLTGEAGVHGPGRDRDPPQGGRRRHGRRAGAAGRLRGRGRADRPGEGLPGGRARGPAARRRTSWPSGSRPTWRACRSGCRRPSASGPWPWRGRSRSGGGARSSSRLAASVLALTTLGGLSTTYYLQQRAEAGRGSGNGRSVERGGERPGREPGGHAPQGGQRQPRGPHAVAGRTGRCQTGGSRRR